MAGSPNSLYILWKYTGSQYSYCKWKYLPIIAIGDIESSFTHVFLSLGLSARLISIGQFVDNKCNVHISHVVICARLGARKVIARA